MENKHSVNSILSFGAKSVDPKILEQLLVGRDKTAEYLSNSIEGIAENGLNQHILVIGQRGMGKTHLLRIVYSRCQKYIQADKLVVAYFSEEEYGVSSYFDFLIRILYAFMRWDESGNFILKQKIEELQEVSSGYQTAFAEKIIADHIAQRPLLILAENFGDILNAIGTQEQGKLRAWMYTNNRISIIATSQSISDDFDTEDRPFYGFFNTVYLKTLSYRDSYNFLKSLAKLDGRDDVLEHLKHRGQAQVRAIHDLVKGNHRLLVTFYEFLKSDTLAKLSSHFIKTINDLKPYYETFIRYLPPMQQKILRYIALSRRPQQGTDVAKNCFIEQNSLSKQLSELVRKKLLEVITDPKDKRNRLYDIDEPLLRISIEVGEHKEGITALFIDFLALYYNEVELKTRIEKYTDLMNSCQDIQEKREFEYEISAIERALKIKNPKKRDSGNNEVLKTIRTAIRIEDFSTAIDLLEKEMKDGSKPFKNGLASILIDLYFIDKRYDSLLGFGRSLAFDFVLKNNLANKLGACVTSIAEIQKDKLLFLEASKYFELEFEHPERRSQAVTGWSKAMVYYGVLDDNKQVTTEGLEKLEQQLITSKNPQTQLDLGFLQCYVALDEDNKELLPLGLSNIKCAAKTSPLNPIAFKVWASTIYLFSDFFDIPPGEFEEFITNFQALSLKDRMDVWKMFAELGYIKLFLGLKDTFLSDLKIDISRLSGAVIDWMTRMLAYKERLTAEQIDDILHFIEEIKENVPEIDIIGLYVDTYREYFINNNPTAVFDLPKEQRIFFRNNILQEHNQISSET